MSKFGLTIDPKSSDYIIFSFVSYPLSRFAEKPHLPFHNIDYSGGPLILLFQSPKIVPLILYKIRGTYYGLRIVNMKTASTTIFRTCVAKDHNRYLLAEEMNEKYFIFFRNFDGIYLHEEVLDLT